MHDPRPASAAELTFDPKEYLFMSTCAFNRSSAPQLHAGLAILLSLSLGAIAGCSEESTSPSNPSLPPTGMGTSPVGAAGMGAPAAPTGAPFTLTIVESVNDTPIPSSQLSLTVRALDNATGQPLPGMETVTDDDARVTFNGLTQPEVGFMIQGVPAQAIDTYSFNVSPLEQNRLLRVVAKSSVLTVKTVANVTLDPQMADVAGAIYWGNDEPVGCVTVTIDDGVGDIRYFASNNLPTTNVALESAPFLEVRTATNPLNGRFYIANVTPGVHTITAHLNGEVVGSASLPAFPGNMSTDGENAISLTDITLPGDANPTPADCM